MTKTMRSDLTAAAKRALIILLEEGSVMRLAHYWEGDKGHRIFFQTIKGLYERYLIKIVVENQFRRRHVATLTDVGRYAALEIKRELARQDDKETCPALSEEAQRFIVEVTS